MLGGQFISLTGFDVNTYQRSIVPMMMLMHCVRPPLASLYRERMVRCPAKYNTAEAPLGRPLGMRQMRQKNLLPFSYFLCVWCVRDQLSLRAVVVFTIIFFILLLFLFVFGFV